MISVYKNSTEIEVTTRRAEIFEKYNPDDGEVNRQYILDNLSIEKTVDKYLELYNKIKED